jgi:phage terminase Nu1 subunit (DNA packaging protein)
MMLIDLSEKTTQQGFGDVVGVGQSAVSEMVSRGILRPEGTLGEWVDDYCSHLREIAAGRAASGDLDLATERAGLAKAQRERIEMQNAVTRRELAPTHLLEEVLAKAGARVAKILDTIPGVIRRREPSLSGETIAAITRDIVKVRNVAAAMSLAKLLAGAEDGEDEAVIEDQEIEV